MSLIKGNHAGLGGSGAPGGALGSFYSHTIGQSLRFDGSSAYLNFTPSSSTTGTVTISAWVKRSKLGVAQYLFASGAVNARGNIGFNSSDQLFFQGFNSSGANSVLTSSMLFRDVSSWYHIVIECDGVTTTSNFPSNTNVYVNGSTISMTHSTASSPSGGFRINDTQVKHIGALTPTASSYFSGYMAEVHWIDGTAVDVSSFGETKDGVWVPKAYSGSHGSAGWFLPFDDSSAIGDDESANTNDWTVSGGGSPTLVASDIVPDSPTNNFTTFSPIDAYNAGSQLSNGNLTYTGASANDGHGATQTFDIANDKFYWEVHIAATNSWIGIIGEDFSSAQKSGNVYSGSGMYVINPANGNKSQDPYASSSSFITAASAGDVIGFACGDGKITIYYNGTSKGDMYTSLTGRYKPFIMSATSAVSTFNFGQDHTFNGNKTSGSDSASDASGIGLFYDTPPSGHLALCTSNMSDATIGPGQSEQADDYFNTVLYTGNGTDDTGITGVGFQPDWVWIRIRDTAYQASLYDSVRGTNPNGGRLATDGSYAENIASTNLKSFDSDGFTLSTKINSNENNKTYVAWNWKAGGAPTADNSAANNAEPTAGSAKIDGSNQSGAFSGSPSIAIKRLSASTTAGFSTVKWTGTGSAGTIPHGLGAAPDFYVVKNLTDNGTSWQSYHRGIASDAETDYIYLNSTAAAGDADDWNDTAPTANVFSVKTHNQVNASGDAYIAYLFTSIESYSKHASFVGNGNANGTFVYTGFRPAWVMIKRSSGSGGWHMFDNKRSTFNEIDVRLEADNVDAENTSGPPHMDFLSSGFKLRTTFDNMNASGSTYIYLAFAEQPFKFANAR